MSTLGSEGRTADKPGQKEYLFIGGKAHGKPLLMPANLQPGYCLVVGPKPPVDGKFVGDCEIFTLHEDMRFYFRTILKAEIAQSKELASFLPSRLPPEDMTMWYTRRIGDWDEFLDLAKAASIGPVTDPILAWRGQPREEWGLRPTLTRIGWSTSIPEYRFIDLEEQLLELFQEHAVTHLPASAYSKIKGRVEWWTLMQHYGAPTRLLDWSASPYVALYFAVNKDPDHDGALWVVSLQVVRKAIAERHSGLEYQSDEDLKVACQNVLIPSAVSFVQRPGVTDRIQHQQVMFSLSPQLLADHAHAISDALLNSKDSSCSERPRDDRWVCAKLVIPRELKLQFQRHLRAMNISAQVLFPGMDGIGAGLTELVRMEAQTEPPKGGVIVSGKPRIRPPGQVS